MRTKPCILSLFLAFSFQLSAFSLKAQQLKLGNTPTQIEKSAVLQMDSKDQGLLLTRLSDTFDINSLNPPPPDGMLIYLAKNPNTGIYVRKNGSWSKADQYFQVSHDPHAVKFIQSNDTVTLNIPNASEGHRGLVSTTSYGQTFKGDKAFLDSLISLSGFSSYSDAKVENSLILKALPTTKPGYLLSTDANGKVLLQTHPNTWIVGGNTIATGTEATLGTLNDSALAVVTDSKERMRITSDGKVGIGTTTPSDVLDVNGSFKLGKNGSSFERMGADTVRITDYLEAINVLDLLKAGELAGPYSFTFNLAKVKQNAMVIVNPSNDLNDLHMKLTVNLLLTSLVLDLGTAKIRIMWVRAPTDGTIEIELLFDFSGVANLNSLSGLLNLLKLGGTLVYSSDPIKFDVLYLNPK